MKCLVFIAHSGFHDETLGTVKLFFSKWGVEHTVTSYSNTSCNGFHGASVKPSVNTGSVDPANYDSLLLVDSKGDEGKVYEYRPLLELLFNFNRMGKSICAIDNSIGALAKANIIKNRRISLPEDKQARSMVMLFHGVPSKRKVEVDGNICTIGDPESLESSMPVWIAALGLK